MEFLPSECICEILLYLTAMETQAISVVSKDFASMTKITNQRKWTEYYKLAGGSIVKDYMVYNLQFNEEYYNPWAKQAEFYQLCDDLFCYNETENIIIIRSMEDELLKWDLQKPSRIISCDFTTGNAYFSPKLILHVQSGEEIITYNYYYTLGKLYEDSSRISVSSKNVIHKNNYEVIRLHKGDLEIIHENGISIVSGEVESASYFDGIIYFMKKGLIYSRRDLDELQIVIKY